MRIALFLVTFLIAGYSIASPSQNEKQDDPFSSIERIELANGLTVYLAPRPKSGLTSVHVEVDVGWEGEDKSNWGVSHLLEHVLFRDKQLHDEMSYLQLIKEAGGTANGETRERETEYYGTIPPAKGIWLLDRFAKMILHPEITADYVEKEKATVELERGKPGPISSFLGFNPMDYLRLDYLTPHDFWRTEFDINKRRYSTLTEEQFSTRRLTEQQVQTHYNDYYYPRNMRLYVGGEFDRAAVTKEIKEKWASWADRKGKTLPPLEEPHVRAMPYARATETYENPAAAIGVKVWNSDQSDEEVLRSYMEYLAHRLMKEIRNKKGQTYSAQASTAVYRRRIGFSFVSFQTQEKNFKENIKIVKDFFKNEGANGAFSDGEIAAAKDLYLDDVRLGGKSAASMVRLAQTMNGAIDTYGAFRSPQQILGPMGPDEYRARLKKMFASERAYQYLTEPPIFFAYDSHIFAALALIFSFFFFRRLLTKKFDHTAIRWVRKIRYAPLKVIEGLVLGAGVVIFFHLAWVYDTVVLATPVLQGSLFFTEYVRDIAAMFFLILCLQGTLSLLAGKLMVAGHRLWIKSITYSSRQIDLTQIEGIEARYVFSPQALKIFFSGFWRFHFYHPFFWQKGMLVTARNGKAYFFGVKNASQAAAELLAYREAALQRQKPATVAA